MIKKGRGGAEGRGEGEANERLVPVISACKTWLSMVITFSIQKATKRARAGFSYSAHLPLRHGPNAQSLSACLSLSYVEFLTSALTHDLKQRKGPGPPTMTMQFQSP